MISAGLRSLCVQVLFVVLSAGNATFVSAQTSSPTSPSNSAPAPQTPAPSGSSAPAQNPPANNGGSQQQTPPPSQPAPNQQKPANPFETVPQTPQNPPPGQQQQPQSGVQEAKPATVGENIVEAVEFRGQRRVPQDTLRALIYTKKGDPFEAETLHRDFMALWNTGRFDDLKLERVKGPSGGIIVRFLVAERRIVRSIDYSGNKSITKSEILDRLKDRKVGLTPESQFDPGKIQRAQNVLQEYLAERGRQYATVTPEIRQVPPSSVEVNFNIKEGPKVKVGKIEIQGNQFFSDNQVIRAMKNLKPIGIPHSILFENIFARTYDSTKLDEDSDRIRQAYQQQGYFRARVINHTEKIYDVGGKGLKIPLFYPNKPGKRAYVTMVVDEDKKYVLRNFNFVGMKLFRTPDLISRQVFQMNKGDVFSTQKLQKGIDALKKLYGDFGYIDFVPEPDPEVVPGSNEIDLTVNVDEGKQFFVRRIDFQGNTTTRDKVIRREILIDEGDLFSNRLWETSILRLNQLGYFESLKPEDAADIKRDTKTNTVDLLLKVKERGKNSIQLNGGVSGIAGSFIGFSYSTNNFLGLGETLSLTSQLGDRLRDVTFGFTEPYLFNKPIQAGFTVFYQRYNYDQLREQSIFSGRNLTGIGAAIGSNNLLNYVSNGRGFTSFLQYQLRRSFARVGLTYGYDIQNLTPLTDTARTYFEFSNFQGIGGPNSLNGIRTSKVIPSFSYNTVDHPITPHTGKRLNISMGIAGLGGNVSTLEPLIDGAYFRRGIWRNHVQGIHLSAQFITGYNGRVAPPFSRYYMGGENDVRGFYIWSISPIAYIPTQGQINVLNADGSQRTTNITSNGVVTQVPQQITVPFYQPISPGGDTKVVFNYEYRIPIFGPVNLAPFFDAGMNRLTRPGQLGLNTDRLNQLNATFPQADFGSRAIINADTQRIRVSTGLELQVLMPVVNAPFRVYWAYNPSILTNVNIAPPFVADRSFFPNDTTYNEAVRAVSNQGLYNERRSTFRFSIGRTF